MLPPEITVIRPPAFSSVPCWVRLSVNSLPLAVSVVLHRLEAHIAAGGQRHVGAGSQPGAVSQQLVIRRRGQGFPGAEG